MKACHSNACQQGRKPCPTPCACEVPEADQDAIEGGLSAIVAIAAWAWLTILVFAAAGLIAGIFYNA